MTIFNDNQFRSNFYKIPYNEINKKTGKFIQIWFIIELIIFTGLLLFAYITNLGKNICLPMFSVWFASLFIVPLIYNDIYTDFTYNPEKRKIMIAVPNYTDPLIVKVNDIV